MTMAAKKVKTDENDFEAMERLARSITPETMRPLTPQQRKRWESRQARPA